MSIHLFNDLFIQQLHPAIQLKFDHSYSQPFNYLSTPCFTCQSHIKSIINPFPGQLSSHPAIPLSIHPHSMIYLYNQSVPYLYYPIFIQPAILLLSIAVSIIYLTPFQLSIPLAIQLTSQRHA
jgi:hypothetical protein